MLSDLYEDRRNISSQEQCGIQAVPHIFLYRKLPNLELVLIADSAMSQYIYDIPIKLNNNFGNFFPES